MDWKLEPDELRVLGSLMEKSVTTPDQYPLTVNALMNACNQKSARNPVMNLTPGDVRASLGRLTRLGLVRMASSYGGRVSHYEHRVAPGDKSALALTRQQYAVLCVLILRGPQTPGELRSRCQRLAEFGDTGEVESVLDELADHPAGRLVVRLPREPGRRESRYAQLLGEEAPEREPEERPMPKPAAEPERTSSLEDRVSALEREVAALKERLQRGSSP